MLTRGETDQRVYGKWQFVSFLYSSNYSEMKSFKNSQIVKTGGEIAC